FVLSQDQTLRRKFVTQFVADFKNLKRLVRFWFCLVFKELFVSRSLEATPLIYHSSLCFVNNFFKKFYVTSSATFINIPPTLKGVNKKIRTSETIRLF
ncbi:hypothetical protein M4D55_25160, partial [Metabacillus idriensis]|uniref:hypothetical protein n=1 Tax=Metabacillus idriensis TaxID=324768 RepID=UPI00203AD8C3